MRKGLKEKWHLREKVFDLCDFVINEVVGLGKHGIKRHDCCLGAVKQLGHGAVRVLRGGTRGTRGTRRVRGLTVLLI